MSRIGETSAPQTQAVDAIDASARTPSAQKGGTSLPMAPLSLTPLTPVSAEDTAALDEGLADAPSEPETLPETLPEKSADTATATPVTLLSPMVVTPVADDPTHASAWVMPVLPAASINLLVETAMLPPNDSSGSRSSDNARRSLADRQRRNQRKKNDLQQRVNRAADRSRRQSSAEIMSRAVPAIPARLDVPVLSLQLETVVAAVLTHRPDARQVATRLEQAASATSSEPAPLATRVTAGLPDMSFVAVVSVIEAVDQYLGVQLPEFKERVIP